MKKILTFTLLVLCMLSCSKPQEFKIKGTLAGKLTQNLRINYFSDGGIHTDVTAARDGAFEYTGHAAAPAILEISSYDRKPLMYIYVADGEEYTVNIDPQNSANNTVSGSDINERWQKFLKENNGKDQSEAVAKYIGANKQDLLSTLLLLTSYNAAAHPAKADSLLKLIDTEARPAILTTGFAALLEHAVSQQVLKNVAPLRYLDTKDSLMRFDPRDHQRSLLVFSEGGSYRTDSIIPRLRKLYKDRKLTIMDISLDEDFPQWKYNSRNDSVAWKQGWATGGVASVAVRALGIPSVPYFIVCDSAGVQQLRSASITEVSSYLQQ